MSTIDANTAPAAGKPEPDRAPEQCEHHHGYYDNKSKYLARLRRIEGQARGIHRMVDEETYCIDILTQIAALTSALENVGLSLLNDHLSHCVMDAAKAGGQVADEKIDEAMAAITRLVKS